MHTDADAETRDWLRRGSAIGIHGSAVPWRLCLQGRPPSEPALQARLRRRLKQRPRSAGSSWERNGPSHPDEDLPILGTFASSLSRTPEGKQGSVERACSQNGDLRSPADRRSLAADAAASRTVMTMMGRGLATATAICVHRCASVANHLEVSRVPFRDPTSKGAP
jgi:hypothetical protein